MSVVGHVIFLLFFFFSSFFRLFGIVNKEVKV